MVRRMALTTEAYRGDRRRLGRVELSSETLLRMALLGCIGAGFLLPSNAAWSLLFYLSMPPLVLWRVWRGWRPDVRDGALVAMLALWLWSSAALFWGDDISGHGNGHGYWLRNAACTLVFVLGFVMAQGDDVLTRSRVVLTLVFCGAANSIVSILIFLWQGGVLERLEGWGVTKNPVLGAAVIGICLVLAIGEAAARARGRAVILCCVAAMLAYLALTFSRTPLLAVAVALAVMGYGLGRRYWLAASAGGLLLAGLAVMLRPALLGLFWRNFAARGSDCHVLIWHTAWDAFVRRPLVGYGPQARLPIQPAGYCPAYPSPHDLYLSLLFYSGAIGFCLFFACVFLLWRRVRRVAPGFARRRWLALGALPLIVGFSDLSQVIKGPSPLWYIIWIPMLLVLTLAPEATGNRRSSGG